MRAALAKAICRAHFVSTRQAHGAGDREGADVKLTSWLQVLREVNLKHIQAEAETPFTLFVLGEPDLTGRLAAVLAGTDASGTPHPWVRQHALPLPPGFAFDPPAVALLLTLAPDLDDVQTDTIRRLRQSGVPTVTVIVGERGIMPPTVWVTRSGEAARAVVPRHPDAASVQESLAPALLGLDRDDASLALALARQLPVLREPYVKALIEDVARTNAGFALSTGLMDLIPGFGLPLTATDVVVLTKNQVVLAYRIALAAGKPGDTRELVGEVLSVIGAGLLFRQIARELVGLIPAIGLGPKIAVAYAGTHLVGAAVRAWALEGRKVKVSELRQLYDTSVAGGRAIAEELMAKARATRGRLPAPEAGREP